MVSERKVRTIIFDKCDDACDEAHISETIWKQESGFKTGASEQCDVHGSSYTPTAEILLNTAEYSGEKWSVRRSQLLDVQWGHISTP